MIKPYEYIVEQKLFDRRTLTQLQHKLRVTLKCYTIIEFKMVESHEYANYFEFKITYRKNKVQFGENISKLGDDVCGNGNSDDLAGGGVSNLIGDILQSIIFIFLLAFIGDGDGDRDSLDDDDRLTLGKLILN